MKKPSITSETGCGLDNLNSEMPPVVIELKNYFKFGKDS